jgi:hypothetical protein
MATVQRATLNQLGRRSAHGTPDVWAALRVFSPRVVTAVLISQFILASSAGADVSLGPMADLETTRDGREGRHVFVFSDHHLGPGSDSPWEQ